MNDGTELAVRDEQPVSAQLAPLADPVAFVAGYVNVANELARVVRDKHLTTKISGRDHVRVEGWTLLGSMLGCFPVCEWTRPVEENGERVGWEARVVATTRDGAVIGAAEAECLRSESTWRNRDDYALRSMAQTRATSKALRQPLGFVMTLAGLEATPAEEMPADGTVVDGGDGMWRWPSGKHRGKTLPDTPREYVEWYAMNGPREDCRGECVAYLSEPSEDEDIPF